MEFILDTFTSGAGSRLVLMTYYGVILLMTGYQADEKHIVRQYKGIVNKYVGSRHSFIYFEHVLELRHAIQRAHCGY